MSLSKSKIFFFGNSTFFYSNTFTSSYTLIGIHQSRQSAGNVKSNVNNINVDNDIISQTFRTSVRFLKRNNDDNKTVNGTYSRLYSSKLFMSQFKY